MQAGGPSDCEAMVPVRWARCQRYGLARCGPGRSVAQCVLESVQYCAFLQGLQRGLRKVFKPKFEMIKCNSVRRGPRPALRHQEWKIASDLIAAGHQHAKPPVHIEHAWCPSEAYDRRAQIDFEPTRTEMLATCGHRLRKPGVATLQSVFGQSTLRKVAQHRQLPVPAGRLAGVAGDRRCGCVHDLLKVLAGTGIRPARQV